MDEESIIYKDLEQSIVKVISQINDEKILGSGFIIKSDGYILTCKHIVEFADRIDVMIFDQSIPTKGRCIGYDKKMDIAVIKIDAKDLPSVPLGTQKIVAPGDRILIMGYPLIGEMKTEDTPSVVNGIISVTTNSYFKFDASVSIGMSGGLVYAMNSGTVIGIVAKELRSIIIEGEEHPVGGIGFAIPITYAYERIEGFTGLKIEREGNIEDTFKKKVSQLYETLGFDVQLNVPLGGYIVDLYATLKYAGMIFNVVIACHWRKKLVEKDFVRNFFTMLTASRSVVSLEKGIIVANTDFEIDAKEFADKNRIEITTYKELSRRMINFDPYLSDIKRKFLETDLSRFYIDVPCTTNEDSEEGIVYVSVRDYIDRYLSVKNRTNIAILGNFGMGKTSSCRKYTYDLAVRCENDPVNGRIPVYIDLKEYKSNLKIQEFITKTLQYKYNLNVDYKTCIDLQRNGQLFFILDGFDEMAERVDRIAINENLREILSLNEIEQNRFIITCRAHFFKNRVDEEKFAKFHVIYLEPWRTKELIEYLRKRFENSWNDYLERIQKIFNLKELARTPIFLEMIVESLPQLEALGKEITSATLYETYTNKWIRQQEERRGGAILMHSEKESFMEHLAYYMLEKDELRIHYKELNDILKSEFGVSEKELQEISNDIRTCSFLVRKDDYYTFSHTSFMEFFVAKKYFKEILSKNFKDFGKIYFKEEIFLFLIDMLTQEGNIDRLHGLAKTCNISRARIHFILILGRLQNNTSKKVLFDIVENDRYSRVSGHAAEILYAKFGEKNAFNKFIKCLDKDPYIRDRNIPNEPNIGWYLDEKRYFHVDDPIIPRYFINVLESNKYEDPNLRWYATSVLSRIGNLSEYVADNELTIFTNILKRDILPRARAYAAVILGNLQRKKSAVIKSLIEAAKTDGDVSVRKVARESFKKITGEDVDIHSKI